MGDDHFALDEAKAAEDGRYDGLYVLCNPAPGCAGGLFQAVPVALLPLFRRINPGGVVPRSIQESK